MDCVEALRRIAAARNLSGTSTSLSDRKVSCSAAEMLDHEVPFTSLLTDKLIAKRSRSERIDSQ